MKDKRAEGLPVAQDLETACNQVKTYWTDVVAGNMPMMRAAFLTNATIASIAYRYRQSRPYFEILSIVDFDEAASRCFAASGDATEKRISSTADITPAFKPELYAPFMAILLFKHEDSPARVPCRNDIERPKDFIPALAQASSWWPRVAAEMIILDSLLRTVKGLPRSTQDPYDLVMGLHPFTYPINFHQYDAPTPISAVFVLRLILETYKSWCILPNGAINFLMPHLRTQICPRCLWGSQTLSGLEFIRATTWLRLRRLPCSGSSRECAIVPE